MNQELVTLRNAWLGNGASAACTLFIVGPVEDDRGPDPAFDRFPWQTQRAANFLKFLIQLDGSHPGVVICERDLPDGNWRDVLEVTASLPHPPPVIVISRLADEYLWSEVLNLGGYDLLAKPLDKQELSRTLKLAWGRWVHKGDSTTCSTA